MEKSKRDNFFLIELESIQQKLSSDYSLDICSSRCIDGPSFSPCKPLQNVEFLKVGNMQCFFRNRTHILTRTQGKKFENMLFVKIASKGTSLSIQAVVLLTKTSINHRFFNLV